MTTSASEPALGRIFRSTIDALLAPRRLIPIAVVILPMLFLQLNYSDSSDPFALPLATVMCVAFLLVAPTLWRYFFPLRGRGGALLLRGLAYWAAGVVLIGGIGRGVPSLLGMGQTFLTTDPSLLVSLALFWVGGWGLARDIDLEADLRASHARAEALAREAEHAQLMALRSHFDPHFLFNTLNAIAEWCRSDGAVAEKAILRLSSMLRTVMSGIQSRSWPLSRELELVDTLFEMYLIRDPELFIYRREVPPELSDVQVPPMILLPAAENAMKHGPSAGNRGEVALRVSADQRALTVEIENPGTFAGPRAGGSGLPMIKKRLALTYLEGAMFDIRASGADPDRTIATIVMPRVELGP